MNKVIITSLKEETQQVGEDLVSNLKDKNIIALYGDLGSGKTTFVQGLAKGLGIKKRIISPTFVLVREHRIMNQESRIMNLYHIDLYRIENVSEIKNLGLEEIMNDRNNIVAIEWAEKMGSLLPKKRLDIRFKYMDENKREIFIESS